MWDGWACCLMDTEFQVGEDENVPEMMMMLVQQ